MRRALRYGWCLPDNSWPMWRSQKKYRVRTKGKGYGVLQEVSVCVEVWVASKPLHIFLKISVVEIRFKSLSKVRKPPATVHPDHEIRHQENNRRKGDNRRACRGVPLNRGCEPSQDRKHADDRCYRRHGFWGPRKRPCGRGRNDQHGSNQQRADDLDRDCDQNRQCQC